MPRRMVEHPGLTIVGLSTRTSNADEASGHGRIGAMWGRFYAENWPMAIPHQTAPDTVLALYTDYEGNADGLYTFAVGVQVATVGQLHHDLTAYAVPPAKYAVFTSARGPIPDIVIDVWKEIWNSPLERAFGTDFEVYDDRSRDRNNAQIDVWVSVR